MSDLTLNERIDYEQEIIRLKDLNGELKEALALETAKSTTRGLFIASEARENNDKAKAWDDFEELVNYCNQEEFSLYVDETAQNPNQITIDTGHRNVFFYSSDLKDSVSNALKSIKGDNNEQS